MDIKNEIYYDGKTYVRSTSRGRKCWRCTWTNKIPANFIARELDSLERAAEEED